MAEKGNDRSNAKISDADIVRILSRKGKVKVFSESYKAFSAGKSSIENNEERLFLCECYDYKKKEIIQSPLNYTGGKYKLLPQLLPHFPDDIDCFIDLFCGGGNVGINVPCNKVLFNDSNSLLRFMFGTFKNLDKESTFEMIDRIIEDYGLSNTDKYGYEHYGCNSADGLSSYNSEKFLKLRNDFNHRKNLEYNYYVNIASKYFKEFDVEKFTDNNENYLFTHDLKSLSGAVLHLTVFSFRLAYIKAIEQATNISLPIVIDSPSGKEVKKENVEKMMNILERDFPHNQVIIASIFQYDIENLRIHTIEKSLMGEDF